MIIAFDCLSQNKKWTMESFLPRGQGPARVLSSTNLHRVQLLSLLHFCHSSFLKIDISRHRSFLCNYNWSKHLLIWHIIATYTPTSARNINESWLHISKFHARSLLTLGSPFLSATLLVAMLPSPSRNLHRSCMRGITTFLSMQLASDRILRLGMGGNGKTLLASSKW